MADCVRQLVRAIARNHARPRASDDLRGLPARRDHHRATRSHPVEELHWRGDVVVGAGRMGDHQDLGHPQEGGELGVRNALDSQPWPSDLVVHERCEVPPRLGPGGSQGETQLRSRQLPADAFHRLD